MCCKLSDDAQLVTIDELSMATKSRPTLDNRWRDHWQLELSGAPWRRGARGSSSMSERDPEFAVA
jgi:hypothetical protein